MEWPPDYQGELARRAELLQALTDPQVLEGFKALYAKSPAAFIGDCCWVYEPRNANRGAPVKVPIVLFPRQRDYVNWLYERFQTKTSAPVEKSRDSGATWIASSFAVWLWLFIPGSSTGFGSRKEILVDRKGDMNSIFEKVRQTIYNVPPVFMPHGFTRSEHSNYMRIINPEIDSSIIGEAGDNIGRGGRAQPLDARILTPTGWSTMGEMRVGSRVIGSNGRSTTVTGVFPQGVVDIYRVTFNDGSSTECCGGHLWRVTKFRHRKSINRGFEGPYREQFSVESTVELALQLEYARRDNLKDQDFQIPVVEPVHFDSGCPLPLDPYLVGALIGDGSIKHIHRNTPAITSGDSEIFEILKECMPDGIDLRRSGKFNARLSDVRGKTGPGNGSPLKKALVEVGLAGRGSHDKFVPDVYKFASPADRLSVLHGLLDTDGWTSKRESRAGHGAIKSKTGYCTTSPQLRDDVIFLVRSLGGTATFYTKAPERRLFPHGRECDCREAYFIAISMPDGVELHRLSRKQDNVTARARYKVRRSIESIEFIGRCEAQCISVDAHDHLYVTDDFIVTHNTSLYVVDEAAYLENAAAVEAALTATTDVRIDISSPRAGTIFDAWTASSKLKFVFDVDDAPWHTQEWKTKKENELKEKGLGHIYRREYLRDATAGIDGQVISSEWIESLIDAHIKLGIPMEGKKRGALDVADGGADANALALGTGSVVTEVITRSDLLADTAADWAYGTCLEKGHTEIKFDSVGVGSSAASAFRRKPKDGKVRAIAWAGSDGVVNPTFKIDENRTNADFFANAKAQAWWSVRERALKTHRAVTEGKMISADDVISLSSEISELRELKSELAQVTFSHQNSGKVIINKKPEGHRSPNRADAVVILLAPESSGVQVLGIF